ncbi:MAG: HEAT repeat domain-containing protein [Sedimentisphaerales bacterium]|nr:HEAT repeat domain-containing protein [Sedimentisphaerales bacterium]
MKSIMYVLIAAACIVCGCQPTQQQTPAAAMTVPVKPVDLQPLKGQAYALIKTGISDNNAYIRHHAIEIAALTSQKELIGDIIQKLNDPSVAVRFVAAAAIGDMRCPTCGDHLKKALADPDQNVQIAGAYALIKTGDASHYPKIREAALSPDGTVRANAILLMGKLGNKDDLPLIYQASRDNDAPDKVRLQAVDSIARLKDVRIYKDKLWPLLISKYADDRVMGIRGMGALGTKEAREAIQTMLKDDIAEVRLCAADELGKLGDSSGLENLVKYFQTNPDLNQATVATGTAVMAIGNTKANNLTGYLAKSLNSESPYLRLAAAQSILLMTK